MLQFEQQLTYFRDDPSMHAPSELSYHTLCKEDRRMMRGLADRLGLITTTETEEVDSGSEYGTSERRRVIRVSRPTPPAPAKYYARYVTPRTPPCLQVGNGPDRYGVWQSPSEAPSSRSSTSCYHHARERITLNPDAPAFLPPLSSAEPVVTAKTAAPGESPVEAAAPISNEERPIVGNKESAPECVERAVASGDV